MYYQLLDETSAAEEQKKNKVLELLERRQRNKEFSKSILTKILSKPPKLSRVVKTEASCEEESHGQIALHNQSSHEKAPKRSLAKN